MCGVALDKVIQILGDYTDFPAAEMNKSTELVNDLGLNSLDVINVVIAFEDEFSIEIPDRAINNFHTVGDIADYLERNEC